MKKPLLPIILICLFANLGLLTFAQSISINTDGTTAHSSAILDVKSTTKGILAPRMTTFQRTTISTPAAGLLVYDTDTNSYWCYNGSVWTNFSSSGIGGSGTANFISKFTAANTIGNSQLFDNGTNIGINTGSPFGKLHIKGSADVSQLIIDANGTQSNSNPLIKLRSGSGADLMWIHSDHPYNTFVGLDAGRANNATGGGTQNTFIGNGAGYSNTTGGYNTANGFLALHNNILGNANIAVGQGALYYNTTASQNTAIGANALTTQSYNNGGNSWLSSNVAVGYYALYLNEPTASNNGMQNTAVGSYALQGNTNGANNTATGYEALYSGGANCTATGSRALYSNTTAFNTADGFEALFKTTTGFSNAAVGYQALYHNIDGAFNTALGYAADVVLPNLSNATAIGYSAVVTASNKMQLGNILTATIATSGGYTIASDGRFKENLRDDVKGLDFIMKLKPVTYNFDYKLYDQFVRNPDVTNTDPAAKTMFVNQKTNAAENLEYKHQLEARTSKRETGFVAQDVEKAVKESGYTGFNGVYAPTTSKDNYALDYSKMVVPLVKAVQEQQAMIKNQQQQIDFLIKRIEVLEKK